MFNHRNFIMKWNYTLPVLAIGLLGWACSSVEDTGAAGTSIESEGVVANTPVEDWKVSGVSQKGPFVTGSVVTVQELDGVTLNQTGKSFRGTIKSDKGDFAITGINLASQYAMLEANGYYHNEVTGAKSTGTVTLRAITDLSDRNTVNINLFTHLEYERVMYLVLEGGKTVAAAKAQAESEILAAFGINVQIANPEDLNIFDSGEGNAALLAVSLLMQGGVDVAGLTERMGNFSMALAAEGKWEDAKTKAAIADWASEADHSGELVDILQSLSEWSGGEVPDFITYVRHFWQVSYGLGNCTGARDGDVVADSNKQSVYYYENSGARFVCEDGNWVKASNLKADTEGYDAGTEGEMRVGQVDSLNKYVYDDGKWREAVALEIEIGAGCTAAMPAKIVSGYVCKDAAWVIARNYDYDILGAESSDGGPVVSAECTEGDTIVGAKTSMGYVCKDGKFVLDVPMQTWFGANGSDSIYHMFSEDPSGWYVVDDGEIDGGNTTVDWHTTVNESNAGWLKSIIDTCKGICGDVTFGDAFVSPYLNIGFSLVQGNSWDAMGEGYNVSSFRGVCIAYSSTVSMSVLMIAPQDVVPDFGFAQFELPLSDTVRVERIPWSSFAEPSWAQPVDSYEVSVQKTTALRIQLSGDAGTTGSFNIKAFGPYDGSCDKYVDFE